MSDMSNTDVEVDIDTQIQELLSGDTSDEGGVSKRDLRGDKGDPVGEPTQDQLKAAEASASASDDSTDISEKNEDEDPEGDLDTDDVDDVEEEEESAIDYSLMVPMPDGQDPIKLGDLKDMVNDMDRSRTAVDEQRMALIKQETELNQYMGAMGIQVPPGFQEHMARQQDIHLQDQHKLMMRMMPEMENKESFGLMRKGIVQIAKASNFTEQEIAEVSDARIIHILNRLYVSEAKHAKAQEIVKKIKSKPKLKGVQRRQAGGVSKLDRQVSSAISSNNRADKDAAIDALLS